MTTTATRLSASDLARLTPERRDRYVDFLRVASIGIVVLGHWLMAVVKLRDGELRTDNVLGMVPLLWLATWLLQVMPLFFFVGGFSNYVTLDAYRRNGKGSAEFIASRLQRLIRPVAVLLAVWIPLAFALERAGISHDVLARATRLVSQPVWFVAAYLVVSALAPVMRDLHTRFGTHVLVALGLGALAADAMRFGAGVVEVGYANMAFVWLFAQQLGFFYADGSLARVSHRRLIGAAAAALGALTLLTTVGPYPSSMVGVGGRSNMSPPTIALIALACMQAALAMLARPVVQRWLRRDRVWTAVVAGNGVIMTVFLWHLTAMLAVVGVLLPLGFPQPDGGTALWWATRPFWIAAASLPLAAIVAMLGRTERPPATTFAARTLHAPWMAGVGVALVAWGIVGLARSNLVDLGLLSTIVPAAAGSILVRTAVAHTSTATTEGLAQ